MEVETSTTTKREYDSLIDFEISLISFYRKYGEPHMVKAAKQRLQLWYKLQAAQEGKR